MFKKTVKNGEDISPKLSNKDMLSDAKKNNAKIRNNIKLRYRKIYIISAIAILVILIVVSILNIYLNNIKYKDYIKYEEKMKTFGFDQMYNNHSAKTNEPVTKSEALKLVLGTVFNTDDISGFAADHTEYENAIWVEYAKSSGITKEDINANNFDNNVKYIDVISYFENCKIKFLKELAIKETEISVKDLSKYTLEQQLAIKDMLENKIIDLMSNKINGNKNIFKGQLNELVVNFAEKYNTIAMAGDKLNVNPEKLPANADKYPYTLANIDKSVYELPFFSIYNNNPLSPKELYASKKNTYYRVKNATENYFSQIININYKTITEESLKQKLAKYYIVTPDAEVIKEYIKYVKENEIVIEGKAELQIPIIYFDGINKRARVRLKFVIKQSKTKENLIYLDGLNILKKTYDKDSYDILVDCYLTDSSNNNNVYLTEAGLYETILDKDKCGISREIESIEGETNEND